MFNRIKVDVIHLNGKFYAIIKNNSYSGTTTFTIINPHNIFLKKMPTKNDVRIGQLSKRLDIFAPNRSWYKVPVLDCAVYEAHYDFISANFHVLLNKKNLISRKTKFQTIKVEFVYDFKSESFIKKSKKRIIK